MTGRRGRMVSLLDGSVQYQLRSEDDVSLELLNIAEKQRFMDGEKVQTIAMQYTGNITSAFVLYYFRALPSSQKQQVLVSHYMLTVEPR